MYARNQLAMIGTTIEAAMNVARRTREWYDRYAYRHPTMNEAIR